MGRRQGILWSLAFLLVILVYAGINHGLQKWLILPSFQQMEQREAEKDLARTLDAINREWHHLDNLASDWAYWDSTYQYIDNPASHQDYIDENIIWESLEGITNINLVFLLNTSGEVQFGQIYVSSLGGLVNVDEFGSQFGSDHVLLQLPTPTSAQAGIMLTSIGPMLISARHILDGEGNGPSRGTIIMGRIFDKKLLTTLSQQTRTRFTGEIFDPSAPATQSFLSSAGSDNYAISYDSPEFLTISGIVRGINNQPALLVRVEIIRDIMVRGRQAAWLASSAVLLMLTVLIIVLLLAGSFYTLTLRRSNKQIAAEVIRKTSQYRAAKEEAEIATDRALEASDSKSVFLANMSHEIRTPLNGIIGMAELAADFALEPQKRAVIDTILREADALRLLISDVLDVSKFEAGQLQLESIEFPLVDSIEQWFSALALSNLDHPLEFICEIDANVPLLACGDPVRIRQILMNIAGNAVKFTEAGNVTLKVRRLQPDEAGLRLQFSISDTGIGMDQAQLKRIFLPFGQADQSITRRFGGTGLGTTIALELIEMMDGELEIISEQGVGSQFIYSLSLAPASSPDHRQSLADANNKQILVALSHPQQQDILSRYLVFLGYEIITFDQWQDNSSAVTIAFIDEALLGEQWLTDAISCPVVVISRSGQWLASMTDPRVDAVLNLPLSWGQLKEVLTTLKTGTRIPTQTSASQINLRGCDILLVEDYPTNQRIASAHLTTAGARVDVVDNGEQAVAAFRRHSYSLILMDLQMPVMDGITASRQIRQLEQPTTSHSAPPVPIIALSAHSLQNYIEQSINAGMNDFLAKPFRRDSLLAIVKKWYLAPETLQTGTNEEVSASQEEPPQDNLYQPQQSLLPLDFPRLVEEFMGERELVIETLKEFCDLLPVQINEMRQAWDRAETDIIRAQAHKIKGGAANLTAAPVAQLADQIEQQASHANAERMPLADLQALSDLIAELTKECRRLTDAVEEVILNEPN